MLARLVALLLFALPAQAAPGFSFANIEGGDLDLAQFRGGPVLVVNTASHCGYTHQYAGLQALWERYRDQGLTVVAVPSDDFRQELATNAAVKEFCEVNYGITLPMAEITGVRGENAHPFYAWLRETEGFEPGWNFYKVLLNQDGDFVAGFTSNDAPEGRALQDRIKALLAIN